MLSKNHQHMSSAIVEQLNKDEITIIVNERIIQNQQINKGVTDCMRKEETRNKCRVFRQMIIDFLHHTLIDSRSKT